MSRARRAGGGSRGRRQLGEALAERVEESLERRPSRKVISAALVALLPLVRARWSLAAVASHVVTARPLVAAARTLAATPAASRATIGALVARWRVVALALATAAIAIEGIADDLGDRTAETCAAGPWPELYVTCEAR